VTFEWKEPDEHGGRTGTQRGFIAQDVEKILPEWVGVDAKGFKTLNTTGLEAMLVESIRTVKAENDSLRDRVKVLEARQLVASAGLNGSGLLGLGFIVLGSAMIVSRRRAPTPRTHEC